MPFVKGQSGNPGGRRKNTAATAEIRELARQHGPEVIRKLISIVRDEKAHRRDVIDAGAQILDRGFGRSMSALDVATLAAAASRGDGGELNLGIEFKDGRGAVMDLAAFSAQTRLMPSSAPPQPESRRTTRIAVRGRILLPGVKVTPMRRTGP